MEPRIQYAETGELAEAKERVVTDTVEVAISANTFRKFDDERWRLCCQWVNVRVNEETDRKSWPKGD